MSTVYNKLPLQIFTGKSEDWHMWSRQFLARSDLAGYRELITHEQKDDYLGSSKDDEMNRLAYCELMMICTDALSFASIDDARTLRYPEGDATKAW